MARAARGGFLATERPSRRAIDKAGVSRAKCAASMPETPHPNLIYASIADVQSRDIAELHDYWRAKLAGRAMPRPGDVDPEGLPALRHGMVLADYSDRPFRVRYRAAGATQLHYSGEDFNGRFLDEMNWTEKHLLSRTHETMCRTKVPIFGRYQWDFRDGLEGFSEFGLFPLSADGATVTSGIAFDDYSFFEQALGRAR